jgi:hypothetical protein
VNRQLRREIASERETAYLLKSEMTKRRILDALQRTDGIPFEAAAWSVEQTLPRTTSVSGLHSPRIQRCGSGAVPVPPGFFAALRAGKL